jgi:hypothetical protein
MKTSIKQIILYFQNNTFKICFTSNKRWLQKNVIVYVNDSFLTLDKTASLKQNILTYTKNDNQKIKEKAMLFVKNLSLNITKNQILIIPYNTFYLYKT